VSVEQTRPRAAAAPLPEVLVWASALGVGLFLVRVLGEPWKTGFDPTFPDSFSYLEVAERGPLRPFDERPVLYPSFLWLVGRSVPLAVLAQSALYAGAFVAFCATAVRLLRSAAAATAAVALAVLLAVQSRFALWNLQILSESLGITLSVAALAAWWRVAARPTRRRVVWAWIATVAWILVRDAHVMPALLVVVPVAVAAGLWWRAAGRDVRRGLLAGAAATVVVCGYVYVAQDVSNRNQYPFHNNVGMRILPDDDLTQWFVDGGMPLDDALRGREGHLSWDDGEAFLRAAELEGYRDWADGAGGRRFLLSLVARFGDWYERLVDDLPRTLGDDFGGYDTWDVGDRLPSDAPGQLGGPEDNRGVVLWSALGLAGVVAALVGRVRRAVVVLAVAAVAAAFVDVYCSYVGDALEVSRHLVGPLARLGLALTLCIALGVEGVVAFVAGRPPAAEPEPVEAAGG
jgi:hypothetical protein